MPLQSASSEIQRARCHNDAVIFTARRYAIARYLLSSCVRLSVLCHKPVLYRNDCTNRAGIWHGAFFHLSHAVLWRNSGISKNRVLSSGTLSQTSDLEISPRQVDRVVDNSSSSMFEFVGDTYIRQSTSRGCLLQVRQL